MPFHPPNPPSGSSNEANWLRTIWNTMRSQRLLPGRGYRLKVTGLGTALDIDLAGGGGAAPAVLVQRMRVTSVQGDYLTCRTWDGTTEGGTDILVAKPAHLRHSLAAQWLMAVQVAFSGYSITVDAASGADDVYCQRTATDPTGVNPSQSEFVLPFYHVGSGPDSEIWAYQPTGGTGVSAAPLWMDLNVDARAWCQVT